MKYLCSIMICLFVSSCCDSPESRCKNLIKEVVYAVTADGRTIEEPFIVVFGNPGHSIEANVLYLLRHDGSFIWSNDQSGGGEPYYQSHIPKAKFAELKKELKFPENVNWQFKFIPTYFMPPDYGFGIMNIVDDSVIFSVLLTYKSHYMGNDVFWWFDDKESLLKFAKNSETQLLEERAKVATDLFTYISEIVGKYKPETGIEVNLSFELRPVEYEVQDCK